MHGFMSELSILFHWSIFLFLCQYHTVLMTVAHQVKKVDSSSSILLKIALVIWGLLRLHMNCEIFCPSSVKNAIVNLMGIALNL